MAKGCAVDNFSPHSLQQRQREQTATAIASEESDISQLDRGRLRRDLETPTPFLDDLAGPSEREVRLSDRRAAERASSSTTTGPSPRSTDSPERACAASRFTRAREQKRLGNDMANLGIEVG